MFIFKLSELLLLVVALISFQICCCELLTFGSNSEKIGNLKRDDIKLENENSELNSSFFSNENTDKNQKIKHFVIIRFYSEDMMEKEKLFNSTFLRNAINDFKKFTLKSLENQTNKNFEVILKIHNEIPKENKAISELKLIKSPCFNINVIRKNEIKKYIENRTKDINFLITTRIDHDDLIYNGAVDEIQKLCNIDIPLYYNGYVNGMTMINDNTNDCYKFSETYGNEGTISIFQSLILNKELYKDYLDIYSLGPHHKQIYKFKELYKGFQYNMSFFNLNRLENAYIYVMHDFNHSRYQNSKLKWHRSKNKVEKNKEWFIKRFGNFTDC